MIRTHIRFAHIASIRTGSPVDSRQCDWGISPLLGQCWADVVEGQRIVFAERRKQNTIKGEALITQRLSITIIICTMLSLQTD